MGDSGASVSTTSVRKPRIGGGDGTADDPFWTGGTNIAGSRRTKPESVLCYRPTDFRNRKHVEDACRSGLAEELRLGLPDEKTYPITVQSWVNEIKAKLIRCGLDSVFYLYNPTETVQERSLLEDYGSIPRNDVRVWIKALTTGGVVITADARRSVCEWDADNLKWSFEVVKQSISFKLWVEIEGLLDTRTGPEVFKAAVDRLSITTSSKARTLVKKIEELKLSKEPGMNVSNLVNKLLGFLE